MLARATAVVALALLGAFSAQGAGGPLVGTGPPAWEVGPWINSEPLSLTGLRGRVVLVRWWTGPHCPLCRASAAALKEWHQRFSEDGLTVVGLYHHKSPSPLYVEQVAEYAASLGFDFPVAIDSEWRTLRRWWLDGHDRGFTSVTFLLDRAGKIQHVHPGGKYVRGDGGFEALEAKIVELLNEPADPAVER
jgi:peroxiredoxin